MEIIQEGSKETGTTVQGFRGMVAPVIYRDGQYTVLGVRKGATGRRPVCALCRLPADMPSGHLAILGGRWIAFMEKLRDKGVMLDEMIGRAAWFASNTTPDPAYAAACEQGKAIMEMHLRCADTIARIRAMRPDFATA